MYRVGPRTTSLFYALSSSSNASSSSIQSVENGTARARFVPSATFRRVVSNASGVAHMLNILDRNQRHHAAEDQNVSWSPLDTAIFKNLLLHDALGSAEVDEAKAKIERVKDMSQVIVSSKTTVHGHIWKDPKIDEVLLRELGRAPAGTPLADVSLRNRQGGVYIFNAMDSHLPQTLLDHGCSHVGIIESTLPSTKKWKNFAKQRSTEEQTVDVHCHQIHWLVCEQKIKRRVVNMTRTVFQHERGPKFALSRYNKNKTVRDESGTSLPGPTMVAVLPVPRQTVFLHALYYGLIRHLLGHDDHSIYDYGQVQTITFLSAASLAQLIGPPRFPFVSKAAKMWSFLLNQVFDVRVIDRDGFSTDYFSPAVRLHGKLTGEKHLRQRDDIVAERFYPVSLTPKTTVTIGGRPIYSGSDVSEEYSTLNLMKYFYWNSRLLREKQLMLIAPILKTWFPLAKANNCFNHLEGRTIKSLNQQELDDVFWLIAKYIKDPCAKHSDAKIDNDPELSPFQLQFAEFFDDQMLDPSLTLFAD